MFKRESEQPVKISFEEKKNNKEKRSLRERLSNIPLRRRVEAVLLAVVTVMASLSIDWSSLLAMAASDPTIESGQSISTVYEAAADNEKLKSAKISVKKPLNTDEVYYTWNVYQNLKDPSDPETGVKVGNGGSGTIKFLNNDFEDVTLSDDSTEQNKKLPDVVLLDDETAAVVFKLTSKDRSNITCKSFGTADSTYVKDKDGDWNGPISGKAIEYVANSGNLTDVDLSIVPDTLGLSAGQSYTFSDIKLTPAYQRKLTFSSDSTLISNANENDPTFKVTDDATKNGTAKVTVGGEGVDSKEVTVNVVSFALKGTVDNNPYVFPYKGSGYNAADLYIATCNNEINNITTYFETTFVEGNLTEGLPQDPGSYTMTITGKGIYKNLSCTKTFTIAQGELTQNTFEGTATVKNGKIDSITGAKFITGSGKKIDLVYGTDFDAAVTATIPGANEVTYTITITGKGNFKNGDTAPTLTAAETSGVRLDSVIDHIGFKDQTGDYNGDAQTPDIVFYDSNNNAIENPAFTYEVKYNGTERSTGTEVEDVPSIINAGEYTATVTGTGVYEGFFDTKDNTTPNGRTYVLKPISFTTLAGLKVTLEKENFEESDSFVIKVKDVTYNDSGTKTLAEGTYVLKDDYSKKVGTHNVTVLGCGNYEGEATAQYTVFPSLPTCATFKLKGEDGKWMSGTLTADDTTEEWNYVWTSDSAYYTYRGNAIEPLDNDISAKVNGDTLYVSSGLNPMTRDPGVNNINVTSSNDKAYFILTLPEKYASKRIKVEFEIKPAQLNALSFTSNLKNRSYTGSEIELKDDEFKVTDKNGKELTKGTDYIVTYENNENAGTATITATGTGNYTGTATNKFTINKIEINAANVDITINDQQLNISGKTVITDMDGVVITMTVPDELGHDKVIRFSSEDFTLSNYANNEHAWIDGDTAADQPQVTITGKRNLTGSKDVKFEILNKTLTGLTWKLAVSGDSYEGVLGSPGTTINLSDPKYGYVVDYAPSLPAAFIKIYDSNRKKMNPGNYTYVETPSEAEGKNTITIVGKGDYRGGEYYFTYDVRKRDINDCVFKQETDGDANTLPTFKLTYGGVELTAGEDNDYTYVTDAKKDSNDKYVTQDGYTVTFTGKNSYTGEKKVTFHIGKPFEAGKVFVTMYGPNGTKTVDGENRLTYFGDNDPYFILTSNKTDSSKKIQGPKYEGGAYDDTGDYNITFEPSNSAERHKVGTTVKVTFTAKGDTWYNPENSDGSDGIEYTYTVVPGSPIGGTGYGDIGSMLSVYTERTDGTPGSDSNEKIKFPGMTGWQNEINLTGSSAPPLVYNYTTEPADPKLWISYNPVASTCASQSQGTGIPKLGNGISSYAAPFKCPFSDIFTFKQGGAISATDTDKRIIVTPTSSSWLRTTNNNKEAEIRVAYDFDNASLSDAEITLEPSNGEYAYTGSSVEPKYMVTMGGSTLSEGTDYVLVGYSKIDKDKVLPKPSEVTDSTLSNIGTKLNENEKPTNAGTYAFVIGPAEGGHYSGYNIAKFTIDTAKLTATVIDPESFSVIYKGENTELPTPTKDNLSVTGVDGTPLNYTGEGSKEDGYYIKPDKDMVKKPRTNATAWVCGTGNYENANDDVSYSIIANIKKDETPNFEKTNLGLTDTYSDSNNCFPLTLDSNGGLTYSTTDGTKKSFNLTDLTLSDGTKNGELKYGEHLTAIVTGINSDNNIATVGKKQITIEAATDAPVKEKRYYYVEVFGDISTAELTFYAGGVKVDGTEIAYTGDTIDVKPSLMFGGYPLINGEYENKSIVPQDGYLDVAKHTMTLEGKTAKYYTGTLSKDFSIVYDLGKNIEIIYNGDNEKLSGHKFDYTGKPVVSRDNIFVKVEGKATKLEESKGDYDISFGSVTSPGTGSVRIEGKSPRSKGSQTVNFYIVGSDFKDGTCVVTLDSTRQVYDGTEKKPAVLGVEYTGKDGVKRNLTEGQDFDVSYSNNINATTEGKKAIVTIKGKNGYSGNALKEFDIEPKALTTADVEFPNVPFGGRKSDTEYYPATPTITVKDGETILQEKKDYEIKYGSGSEGDSFTDDASAYFTKAPGGKYTINITGKGNYYTEPNKPITATAEQLPGDLKNARIDPSLLKSPYDGTNQKDTILSKLVVKNGECTLVRGTDYEVTVPDSIINAGTYPITISATEGDYKGTSNTFTYEVTQRSIEELEVTLYDPNTGSIVSESSNFKWTGSKIEPAVKLEDKGLKPDAGVAKAWTNKDGQAMVGFKVTYGTNTNAGSKEDKAGVVTLTASAGGNYTGTLTRYFAIGQDIANASITYDKYTADYDGTPKIPKITVKCNGKILEAGTAYEDTIEFEWAGGKTNAPEKVGSYTPVIVGKPDGGYYGELKGTPPFMITATNKSGDIRITFNGPQGEVEAADYVCHYNGSKQEPSINVYDKSSGLKLTRDIDYTVTYGNNTNVGSAYVYVWLEGNYTGSAKEIFFIEPYDISNLTPVITEGENGVIKNVPESKFPYVPIFKLVGTDDYGKPFEISYGTSTYKPYLSVPDSSKVKKPGKGTLTVTGKGNLIGTTNACEYEVYGRLSESNVSVKAPVYTGTKKDPEVTVTFAGEKLVLDTDYSLRIIPYDQTATGGGNVVVTGLGYFSGSVYTKYGEAGDVSSLVLRGYNDQYVYSGRFAGPAESAVYAADSEGNQVIPADKLECTFTSSVDKAACVSANATVTITSKATLDDGTVVAGPSATYKIVQRNISSCDIKQLTSDIYTGKALTPPISVSYDRKTYSGTVATGSDVIALVSGRDYSLSYSNNVNPGTAVVTVTGKGNYTGTKRFMFTIKVADMATVTARQSSEGTIVSWTARPHVTGYRVLYNTNGMTKEETSRTTMTLRDALPTVVGVQAYVKDSAGNITYGTPKYVAVTR